MSLCLTETKPKPGRNKSGKTTQQINRGPLRGWYLVIPRYVVESTPPPVREVQTPMLEVTPDDNPFGGEDK